VHRTKSYLANRPAALMEPAPDAVQIDTTRLSVDEVVAHVEALVRARLPA
jgi:cytidylate kinase